MYGTVKVLRLKFGGRSRMRPGFTLIEVVSVLLILGLLVVTAFVVQDDTDYNLLSQAQAIRQHIRYAHSMAMKTGAIWGVNSNGTTYWAFEGTTGTVRSFPGQETPVVLADQDVSMTSFTVYFDGSGRPTDATGENPSENYLAIKVGPGGWDFTGGEDPTQMVSFRILPDTGFIEVVE